jgi:hypothetical protein
MESAFTKTKQIDLESRQSRQTPRILIRLVEFTPGNTCNRPALPELDRPERGSLTIDANAREVRSEAATSRSHLYTMEGVRIDPACPSPSIPPSPTTPSR